MIFQFTYKQSIRIGKQVFRLMAILSCLQTFAKFRCGVAPLRLETGRYERLSPEQRTCFYCTDCIESEEHVLLSCPVYDDLRLTV